MSAIIFNAEQMNNLAELARIEKFQKELDNPVVKTLIDELWLAMRNSAENGNDSFSVLKHNSLLDANSAGLISDSRFAHIDEYYQLIRKYFKKYGYVLSNNGQYIQISWERNIKGSEQNCSNPIDNEVINQHR